MNSEAFIQCRVPVATKLALRAAAQRQQLTESALLKRMLEVMLSGAAADQPVSSSVADGGGRHARLYVRLTSVDRRLLDARAKARCLPAATYASNLLRAHLNAVVPLPEAELQALRQATRELAAIGRNVNQIARMGHQGGDTQELSQSHVLAILKVCGALRDHFRGYVIANLKSWESGDATVQD